MLHSLAAGAAALALAGCTTVRVPGAGADDAIRALERQRLEAMVAGDARTLERILADDLEYGHSTGAVESKATLIARLADGSLDYVALQARTLDVRLHDGAALASGTLDVEAIAGPRRLKGALRFLAVYVRRDARWQLVAYQSTALPP